LSERRLAGDKGRLAESLGLRDDGGDAEGLCREAGGDDNGTEELHGCLMIVFKFLAGRNDTAELSAPTVCYWLM